jgi:hypothetical protein
MTIRSTYSARPVLLYTMYSACKNNIERDSSADSMQVASTSRRVQFHICVCAILVGLVLQDKYKAAIQEKMSRMRRIPWLDVL